MTGVGGKSDRECQQPLTTQKGERKKGMKPTGASRETIGWNGKKRRNLEQASKEAWNVVRCETKMG